jgi:hypothetical protein
MKRAVIQISLSIALVCSIIAPATLAQEPNLHHHAATKVCKQRYKDAVRGARLLRGRARKIRIAEAKRERRECMLNARR